MKELSDCAACVCYQAVVETVTGMSADELAANGRAGSSVVTLELCVEYGAEAVRKSLCALHARDFENVRANLAAGRLLQ